MQYGHLELAVGALTHSAPFALRAQTNLASALTAVPGSSSPAPAPAPSGPSTSSGPRNSPLFPIAHSSPSSSSLSLLSFSLTARTEDACTRSALHSCLCKGQSWDWQRGLQYRGTRQAEQRCRWVWAGVPDGDGEEEEVEGERKQALQWERRREEERTEM